MNGKLSDMDKKRIIAERADGMSNRKLASKYHVSEATIRRVLKNEPEMTQIVAHKKEQNALDMLAYMDSRKASAQEFIDLALESIKDPRKLDKAGLQSIATALGIIVDKFIQTAPERDSDTMKKAREILGDVKSAID